jgi:hypothetical protein
MGLEAFKQRVLTELLPQYCDDPSRGWGSEGFKPNWGGVSEVDAQDFLRGLDAGLVQHIGRGQYLAKRSATKEQFFWEGKKCISPRPISLWLEPIITVAGLTRLHFEFGWPEHLIGMQSQDYAFDLAAYLGADQTTEHIACEVKNSLKQLDDLIKNMRKFGIDSVQTEAGMSNKEVNAYRKLVALRKRKAPIFWVLGPGRASFVFNMSYSVDGVVTFSPAEENLLSYRGG